MKTYLIKEIPDELWFNFKSKVTKEVTISQKIISLIEGYVKNANS